MRCRAAVFYFLLITRQSCRDKRLMYFVRQLVLICLRNNIVFKAKHVPGSRNGLADALSRLQVQTFQRLAPSSMDTLPTDIPLHLQPTNAFHRVKAQRRQQLAQHR